MRSDRRSRIAPLLVSLVVLAGCGGNEGSDDEQATESTDAVSDTSVDGGDPASADQDTATTTRAFSSTSALSITTAIESTSTSSTTRPRSSTTTSTPCSSSSIAGDLGAGSTVVDGACESGWAVVDVCEAEPCGDSWVLARHQGGGWAVVTGFPTGLCRSELAAQGAPDRVLDVVNWPPCAAAPTSTPTSTSTSTATSGTVDAYAILDVFISAWNAGDWVAMSSVADSSVVDAARAAAVPGGSVQPGPARGRCFFGFPDTTCEVAYGSDGAGNLYTLTITDRITTMERSG